MIDKPLICTANENAKKIRIMINYNIIYVLLYYRPNQHAGGGDSLNDENEGKTNFYRKKMKNCVPRIDNNWVPRIDNNWVPRIDNNWVLRIDNNWVPRIYNNWVPRIDNNWVPRIDNNWVPRIDNNWVPRMEKT